MLATAITERVPPRLGELELADFSVGDDPKAQGCRRDLRDLDPPLTTTISTERGDHAR